MIDFISENIVSVILVFIIIINLAMFYFNRKTNILLDEIIKRKEKKLKDFDDKNEHDNPIVLKSTFIGTGEPFTPEFTPFYTGDFFIVANDLIPDWSPVESYMKGMPVFGSDGLVYISTDVLHKHENLIGGPFKLYNFNLNNDPIGGFGWEVRKRVC